MNLSMVLVVVVVITILIFRAKFGMGREISAEEGRVVVDNGKVNEGIKYVSSKD